MVALWKIHTDAFLLLSQEAKPPGDRELNVSMLTGYWKGICIWSIQPALANNWEIIDQQMCIQEVGIKAEWVVKML